MELALLHMVCTYTVYIVSNSYFFSKYCRNERVPLPTVSIILKYPNVHINQGIPIVTLYSYLSMKPKPSLKIRTANDIFWISLGIFRDYGLKNIFGHLFEIEFLETS